MKEETPEISFLLNGIQVHIKNVQPTDLLIDYLRSPGVNLTGTKLSCGEGGCGACTVMLSYVDEENNYINNPINACLRPLCSLDGTSITTIEGINGSKEAELIQQNMVTNCASQCGYCSPGFVMTMYGLLKNNAYPAPQAIEDQFAGNICRCTGYISILKAMHQTGNKWQLEAQNQNGKPANTGTTPFHSISMSSGGYHYFRPITIKETLELLTRFQDSIADVKLVQGNTSVGIYKKEVEDPHILIDISKLTNFHRIASADEGIILDGGVTIGQLLNYLDGRLSNTPHDNAALLVLRDHIRQIAGVQVRNVASVAGSLMLVKKHEKKGEPFPGDLFTVLSLLNATLTYITPDGKEHGHTLLEFPPVESLDRGFLITSIFIPLSAAGNLIQSYRVARRTQNSHPIVNAAFSCMLADNNSVQYINLVYGGLGRIAIAMVKTREFLLENPDLVWGQSLLNQILPVLTAEIENAIVPATEPIFSKEFLMNLAINLFYKFFVYVCREKEIAIDPAISSAGDHYIRPLATGDHNYLIAPFYDGETGTLNNLVHFKESGKTIEDPLKTAAPTGIIPTQLITELVSGISLLQKAPEKTSVTFKETTPIPDPELTEKALVHVRQQSQIKIDAPVQINGTARYTHDLNDPVGTLQAVYVYSTRRNAHFTYTLPMAQLCVELASHFTNAQYIHTDDIPVPSSVNDIYDPGNPGNYDPIFARNIVTCYGMPIGVVVAPELETAKAGARFIQDRINYQDIDPQHTFADLKSAVAAGSVLKTNLNRIPFIFRPVAVNDPEIKQKMEWMNKPFKEPGKVFVCGHQSTGAQYHFYMEPQGALAIPREDNQMEIYSSTQNQSSVHKKISSLLGQPQHNVRVGTTRLGGGFGGKELRQVFVAGAAAVAAWKLKKPVRLLQNRNTDMRMMGTRHPFDGDYYISAAQDGKIEKMRIDYRSDGGISYDCSFPVMDLAVLCAENAYYAEVFKTNGEVYRTNNQSRTAFRSFGLVQAMLITETSLEHLAFTLGKRADEVRSMNFYRDAQAVGDKPQYTPYGSPLPYCRINQVWRDFKNTIDFESRLEKVKAFNSANRWRKRGLAIIPLKYGISYTFRPMNQGSAYVFVYKEDGSVILHHGGVEMGQGMHTKMVQLAAEELGIDLKLIRIAGTNTAIIPNVSSTGASTGSDLNGYAVRRACGKLKAILGAFLNELLLDEQHTRYPDTILDSDTIQKYINDIGGNWKAIIKLAANARISLSAQFSYASPHLGAIPTNERDNYQITPANSQIFYYYTYSAAASEVEVDALTGQFEILRSDIVYDAGDSLNDNIDYGQIEGGFIQGVGCLTTEEMLYAKDGRVISDGTWEYKPPCSKTIPQQFNVYLLKYESSGIKTDPPKDSYGIQSSKSTGEPPLVLANSVFFAIRQAIHEVRKEAGNNAWFEFTAPATVQKIQLACLASLKTNTNPV